MLLRNGSFEDGWYHPDGISELQIPNEWVFEYAVGHNPVNSDPWNEFVRPEVRVLSRDFLPLDEQEEFILDGDHCLKIFKGNGAWNATLTQTITLEPGVYQIRFYIYGDLVNGYDNGEKIPAPDPLSGRVRLVINGQATQWKELAPLWTNAVDFGFSAESAGEYDLGIEFMLPFALPNSGIFADAWQLYKVLDLDCRGKPRVQYERVYVLMPPDATEEWISAVTIATWKDKRYTVGGSADDAGIGDLDNKKVIAVNPEKWGDSLDEFFNKYYPGVEYTEVTAKTPSELLDILKGNTPKPPPVVKTTRGYWGLHSQVNNDETFPFIKDVKPSVSKHFSMQDARDAKLLSPDTYVVYRQVENNQGPYLEHPDPKIGATNYLNTFAEGIWQVLHDMEHLDVRPLLYVESLNETYPSYARDVVRRAAKFDEEFAYAVYREFGDLVGPVVFCTAVGNPAEEEYDELQRVAAACMATNGLMGYHTYWWANQNVSHLKDWWKYHAGRWTGMDKYLSSKGYKVKWFGGESGPVHSYDGYALNPGAGWKWHEVYNGNLDLLMKDFEDFEQLVEEWNKNNEYRFLGNTFFTSGAGFTGWEYFQFRENEIKRLKSYLLNKYP